MEDERIDELLPTKVEEDKEEVPKIKNAAIGRKPKIEKQEISDEEIFLLIGDVNKDEDILNALSVRRGEVKLSIIEKFNKKLKDKKR